MTLTQYYFEFGSPYSDIAPLGIDEVAGRSVDWLPIEIPAVWPAQGALDA